MSAERTDEELLAAYRLGDVPAFRLLLRRHQRPIYNFILRQVSTAAVAEDLAQDTFTKVVQNASSFKEEARFTTWVYTIARNLCIDHLRKSVHRRHPSLDAPTREDDGTPLGEQIAANDLGVDRRVIGREFSELIQTAVERLPSEQREVFLMRYTGELSFKEIAEVTGVSENTVKSRMRYALERLQAALSEFEEYAKTLQ